MAITPWVVGERVTAARLNSMVTEIADNANKPICQLVQQTAQTGWTSGTLTDVTFGTGSEIIDTDGAHNESSNTARIVIGVKLGWWAVQGLYCPPGNGNTTLLRALIAKNGSALTGSLQGNSYASNSGFFGLATRNFLVEATSATDYITLQGYQTASAGTIGTAINTYIACSLTATWVRPS